MASRTSKTGFAVEVSSRDGEWWRYNVALMCGCFDAAGHRIGFASASSHVADVGAGPRTRPAGTPERRSVVLTTDPCDHLMCYLYIIPHTLPEQTGIDGTPPFEISLSVSYGGKRLRSEKRLVNRWSGASLELRIENR